MTSADRDHLRTLSICHYVLGGVCFIVGCFPLLHLAIGIAMVGGVFGQPQQAQGAAPFPAELFGWFFIVIAATVIAFYWALAACLVAAGGFLKQRRRRVFCLVTAGFACLFQPLGLVLGIFTFIVLLRPSVRDAFEPAPEEPPEDARDEHNRYYSD